LARGFETVSYMLAGTVEHGDFLGHRYVGKTVEAQAAQENVFVRL